LLLALGVSLITVLTRRLRVLFSGVCVFTTLAMVPFAMMFGSGTMGFRGILVMICSLVVLVSCHVFLF
jgi:hypothetical protein